MARLAGKVAIITGSARGIGKQIALCFARKGADIVLNDLREKEMEATASEIRDLGRTVITVIADISTRVGAEKLINSAIKNLKKTDILVNNAGIGSVRSLLETTEDEWDRVHNVDLKGVFLCTQAVAKHMIKQKYGKIINMSSGAGLGSDRSHTAYVAAKGGVIQLTKVCARELGPYGINVNSIAPGSIITDLTYTGRTKEEVEERIQNTLKATALNRYGTAEDIANVALFLASDESSFITGQTILCDGGRMNRMV